MKVGEGAAYGYCPACPVRDPGGESTYQRLERHHMKLRSRGGSDDPVNIRYVCATCHEAITNHRGEWTKAFRTHSWQEEGETEAEWALKESDHE